MSGRHCATLMLLTMLALTACGTERTFPPPEPTPNVGWTMRLTQTGGFAGVHYVIQVTSAGDVQAEDQRTGRTATLRLSAAELAVLESLRQEVRQGAGRRPSACADCFLYDLEIESRTGILRMQADDTTLADSGAQALIDYLRALRDRALTPSS